MRAAGQGEQPQSGWLVGLLPHDAAPPVVLHAVAATGPEQFGAHPSAYPRASNRSITQVYTPTRPSASPSERVSVSPLGEVEVGICG